MTIVKRIFKAGLVGFYRNMTVSLSSIFVLTITLSIIMSLTIAQYIFNYTLDKVKDKVDVRVYLRPEATDDEVTAMLNSIKSIPNIRSVLLESKLDALAKFKDAHKNDKTTMLALEEIEVNPFGASIAVQSADPRHYEEIVKSIQKKADENLLSNSKNVIDKINYYELKSSIDKINTMISWLNKIGTWIAIVFITMSCMIVYNTIRIAIYAFREEIGIMKLVGASNTFIRGPFIVEAAIYAIVAVIITIIIFYILSLWLTTKTSIFLEGLSIIEYYKANILHSAILLLISGIFMTSISSFFAVRKYLKV